MIIKIINISLIVLFIALIIFTLVSGLISMKKGIFKVSFKFICLTFLILLSIFMLDKVAELIGTINLNFIGYKFVVITNNSGDLSYNVPITNLFDTLQESLKGFYLINGIAGNSHDAYTFSVALAGSIIKLVSFLVEMIVVIIIGNLLISLLWHIIFKRLIPLISRKKTKLKLLSFGVGAINFALCAFLFLSPLTSLANLANQAYQATKKDDDSEKVKEIGTYIDAYNNSIFAQAFFNWTVDKNGLTIDSKIMEYITKSTSENVTVSLYDEIGNLLDIGTVIGNSLIVDEDGNVSKDINYTYLLSEGVLESLFATAKGSNIILYILPIAFNIASNLPEVSQYVDTNLIENENINWEKEIDLLETVFLDLRESGVFSTIIDEENHIKIDAKEVVLKLLEKDSYPYVNRILKGISDSNLMSNLLPIVMYKAVNSEMLGNASSYVFKSFDQMNDVDWGNELSIVYDTLFEIKELDNDFANQLLDSLLNNDKDSSKSLRKEENDSKNNLLSDFIEFLGSHFDDIVKILIGNVDKNGNLIDVDENGYSIVYKNNKKVGRYTIFDSAIMKGMLEPLFNNLTTLLESKFDKQDFTNLKNSIKALLKNNNEGKVLYKVKKEFVSIFNILSSCAEYPDVLSSIINNEIIPEGGDISDLDPNVIKLLSNVFNKIDRSNLLSNVVFPVIQNLIEVDFKDAFSSAGLKVELFDFKGDNLGKEYAKVFNMITDFIYIFNLKDEYNDTTEYVEAVCNNYGRIANILNTIHGSKIINPNKYNDENFYNLLNYIFNDLISMNGLKFKQDLLPKNLKWSVSTDVNGNLYTDKFGNYILDGEIGAFANVLRYIGKDGMLSALQSGFDFENNLPELETKYHISSLLDKVEQSYIFKLTMGDFFDLNLEATGLIDVSNHISFNNVENWSDEGKNLAKILNCIDQLNIKLNNIDFTAIKDVVGLNNLLHYLSDSGIFNYGDDYLFSSFLYSKIKDNLKIQDKYLLIDPDDTHFDYSKTDFDKLNNKVDWNNNFDKYDFDKEKYITSDYLYYENPDFYRDYEDIFNLDEIGKICQVIFFANKLGDFSSIDINNIEPNSLSDLLKSINNCDSIGRMCVFNMYDFIKDNVNFSSFSLKTMNTSYILSASKEDMDNEIDCLKVFYDLYYENKDVLNNSDLDLSLLTENVVNQFESCLISLNESYIFHRAGLEEGYKDRLTVFQSLICFALNNEALNKAIYDNDSPKDIQYGFRENRYTNSNEKSSFLSKSVFPCVDNSLDTIDYSEQTIEINKFIEVFKCLIGGNIGDTEEKYKPLKDKDGNITFDFDLIDLTNEDNIQSIEFILRNCNNSELLYDCVPSVLKRSFSNVIDYSSTVNFKYLKFSDANFYYQYILNSTKFDFEKKYDNEEIDVILDLLSELNKYSKNEKSGIPNFKNLTLVDSSAFNYLLDQLAGSSLFNNYPLYTINRDTGKREIISKNETTIYQQVFIEVLLNDGIEKYYYSNNNPKDKYFNSNSTFYNAQTKAIYNIKSLFNNPTTSIYAFYRYNQQLADLFNCIVGANGYEGLSTSLSLSNLDFDNVSSKAVYDVLTKLNESDIFYDVAVNFIDELRNKVDDKFSGKLTTLKFAYLNPFYQYGVSYDERLDDDDLTLIKKLMDVQKDGLSFLTQTGEINFKDVDLQPLKDLGKWANTANISHRGKPVEGATLTFYQSYLEEFLNIKGIKGIIYSSDSPKDLANVSLYNSAENKIHYLISTIFDFDATNDEIINQCGEPYSFDSFDKNNVLVSKGVYGEMGNIFTAFEKLKELKSFDLEYLDLDANDSDVIVDLLTALNNSSTLYDSVSNAINSLIKNIGTSSSSNSFKDVDFSKGDAYYHYTYGRTTPDYSIRYDQEEIITLGNLINDYSQTNKLIGDKKLEDIRNLNTEILNSMENLIKDLHSSYVFNLGTKYLTDDTNTTVFEDTIISLMDQTKLTDRNYLSDSPLDASFSSKDEKIKFNVKSLTKKEINSSYTFKLHSNWDEEISSIFDLFRSSYEVLNKNDSVGTNIYEIDSSKLNPDDTKTLMHKLNCVDIVSDGLNYMVKDSLEHNFNIVDFAMFSFDGGTSRNYLDFYISQLDFRNAEIDIIYSFMNNLSTKDTNGNFKEYISFDDINDLTNNHKIQYVLDFLTQSKMTTNNRFEDQPDIFARDVMLLNIFKTVNLTNYISGGTYLEKNNTIRQLFCFIDTEINGKQYNGYNSIYEATALENIISKADEFKSINPEDLNDISTNLDLIVDLFESTYNSDGNNHRSYFVSDLVANFINLALNKEYKLIDNNHPSYIYKKVQITPLDFFVIKQNDYDNLNEFEKNGLKGGVSAANIETFNKSSSSVIKESFSLMGSYTNYGNSKIASIYYVSRIKENIEQLKLLGFNPNPSDNTLFDNNTSFSFKVFGEQLCDYLYSF